MLVILIKIDLHLLKVALIFLSKILLPQGVNKFIKEIKKLVPRALLSYTSTWEFSHTSRASFSISFLFLKIPACLYHSTMYSARFLFF